MAQNNPLNFPIDPFTTSGVELATRINELFEAYKSTESGTSRPAYAVQGYQWLDINATRNIMKFYTGALDLSILEYDTVDNTALINGGAGFTDKAKAILFKYSTVANEIPNPSDMRNGEIMLNLADSKIFALDDGGNVKELGGGDFVDLVNNQTIDGVKTFSLSPIVPNATTAKQAVNKEQLDTKVALAGNQTIAGIKTFSLSPIVPTPTQDLQVATKKYVDDNASDITIASTAEAQAGTNDTKAISPLKLHQAVVGGVVQSWQNVSASRGLNITYTNNTGRPIMLSISVGDTRSGQTAGGDIYIDNVKMAELQSYSRSDLYGNSTSGSVIVPNGSNYKVTVYEDGNDVIRRWFELR